MRTVAKTAGALTGALALTILTALPAHAVPGSTTVLPKGDHVSASLPAGGTLDVTIDGSTGSCTSSTSTPGGTNAMNRIPTLNNPNPSGPVVVKVNPPVTSGCDDGVAFTTVTVTTSGVWKVALQHRTTGLPKATLTIPQGGVVVTISGLANCTATVAPDARARVVGTFTNGSPSTLTFTNRPVPLRVTGGSVCPTSATQGFLTVTYEVRDVDNPAANVTVTA